jgi:hypothetical protein
MNTKTDDQTTNDAAEAKDLSGSGLGGLTGSIFELVDTTNEETYFTMGLFSTLSEALAIASQGTRPPPMEIEDDLVLLEIRERPIGKIGWSELGEVRAKIRWVRKYSDEDEDSDGRWIVSLSNKQISNQGEMPKSGK